MKAEPGEISHGTLREEDLIPRFLRTLETLDFNRAQDLWMEFRNMESGSEAISEFLNETLFDVLQEYAPKNYYFGASVGDGSSFGYFLHEE